ncbi:MAG: hypothetical protein DI585_00575 [Pseudomonas fluorescens]|nr:MAG: hypothetical protein DI585_00575 [Pseudomonas fluorescens]
MKKLSLLFLTLISACTANPATGGYNFSLVSKSEERAIGESAASFALKTDGLYRPASETTRYVLDLCNRMYAVTEAAAEPVQCNVVDSDVFNAYATPGYMFVNRGLLAYLSSEAELAGVLGHESGHLTGRHIANAHTKAKVASILATSAAVAVAATTQDDLATQAAISGAGVASGIAISAYGRSQETEADALGQRYLEKAGYDPREMVNVVRAMKGFGEYRAQQNAAFNNGEIAPTSLLSKLNSSHPATSDRLAAAIALKGEPPVLKPEDDAGRRRYMAAIEGMVFGPARRNGIARKSELVLPAQRVVIPLPEGVTVNFVGSGVPDTFGTWLIGHPQSGAYVKVDVVKIPAGKNPGTLLKTILPNAAKDVQRVQVGTGKLLPSSTTDEQVEEALNQHSLNGLETESLTPTTIGYTTVTRKMFDDKRARFFAFAAPAAVNQMLVLKLVYPNEEVMAREDGNLMSILRNVQFLTKTQALKYKPLQIHTFTAALGETVANRAAKLPVGALQENLFRAMNNLPAGTDLTPGQLYKTVIDLNP